MTNRAGRTHYVKHNAVTRIPRTFIYLDSEARQEESNGTKVQTFRLAVAAIDRRQHHRDGWKEREWQDFTSPSEIWEWVDSQCQPKARTVLVAHKLDYDLRICNALRELTSRGWELVNIRLDATAAWASWKKGSCSLVMSDSLSWLNMGLERIGGILEIPKLPLPAWDDSDEAWFARCRRDVEILAAFYRRLIEWVKSDDLGNWKPTGAGQAWAAYRHRFMTHFLLVHENEDAKLAERLAGWTGRCEAWQYGKIKGGPFTEWDYSAAYARIGAESKVPTQLIAEINGPSLLRLDALSAKHAVLAECVVTTDIPSVPTRLDKSIIWPVGTFTSTLWDTEIALAREYGAIVEPTRAWYYARKPAIQEFCQWCLSIIDAKEGTIDPIVRLAVKHWSRALIGRFAAKWSRWEEVGRSPWDDISLGWAKDVGADEQWRILQLGRQLLRQTEEMDSQDAVPGVMTWVMAECRARLFRASYVAGIDNVAYMDTDSLIVNREGHQRLLEAQLPHFRVKGQWNTLEILGPRQLILAGSLRASGVSRDAIRVDETTWDAETWAQFSTSISSGEADRVRITPRRVKLIGKDTRRLHGPNGATYPIAI